MLWAIANIIFPLLSIIIPFYSIFADVGTVEADSTNVLITDPVNVEHTMILRALLLSKSNTATTRVVSIGSNLTDNTEFKFGDVPGKCLDHKNIPEEVMNSRIGDGLFVLGKT